MARKKTEIDEKEIDEILNLFIKTRLHGVVSKLSYNGVKKFNEEIAFNDNYIRENGEQFKLYKYNFWAGKYNGVDLYGKKKIDEKKKQTEVKAVGEMFSPDILDVIALVDKLHTKPEELSRRLCKLFDRQIRENEMLKNRLSIEIEQKEVLRKKLEMMGTACTNIMFQSQSPNNSLNDMFKLRKEQDVIPYNELVSMFNEDEERINKLIRLVSATTISEKTKENIIQMPKKSDKSRFKGL